MYNYMWYARFASGYMVIYQRDKLLPATWHNNESHWLIPGTWEED